MWAKVSMITEIRHMMDRKKADSTKLRSLHRNCAVSMSGNSSSGKKKGGLEKVWNISIPGLIRRIWMQRLGIRSPRSRLWRN